MIRHIINADITSPENPCDIIIGMNTALDDVTGIGRRFVRDRIPAAALDLGSVITFQFDKKRRLHMLICHELGTGGWRGAPQYVRFGMDYLDHLDDGRDYSIVQIGTGRIGRRDGADASAIHQAMATSYLLADLYVYDAARQIAMAEVIDLPRPLRAWSVAEGELQLAA